MHQFKLVLLSRIISLFTITVGSIALLGWILDIGFLKSVLPGFVTITANTSLLFILTGTAYCLFHFPEKQNYKYIAFAFSIVICVFGLLSLSQDIFGFDAGIDQLFIKKTDDFLLGLEHPGRMSSSAAFCFSLMGFAGIFLHSKSKVLQILSQYALHLVATLSAISLLAFLYRVPLAHELRFFTSMAVLTSFTFFLLSMSTAYLRPSLGLSKIFMGEMTGNHMARRLFPLLILIVVILGYSHLEIHRRGLMNNEFSEIIFVISFAFVGLFIVASTAQWLNDIEKKRLKAEIELIKLNTTLEKRIKERTHELNHSLNKLKESESRLKSILDNSPSIICLKDIKNRYLMVNKAYETILGIKNEELKGKTAFAFFPKEDAERWTERNNRVFKTGKIETHEEYVEINGKSYIYMNATFPLINSENEIYAICEFNTDMTEWVEIQNEIKAANKQLKSMTEKLTQQNKNLADFAYITSHNLRSPVSNLNTLLSLYETEEDPAEKEMLFSKFGIVINHLTSTLNELIEALKVKVNTDVKLETLSFEDCFNKTLEIIAGKILQHQVTITSDFSKVNEIEYNKEYLESIFLNLIGNAIKYRSPQRKPVIHVKTNLTDKKEIVLSIQDNGLGIDLERHGAKMFKLHKTFHRHPQAKGVGLFMTHAQIEALGGVITVESEVEVGTTFKVIFNKK